ncbi:MAG TPA: alpha/beta fold hydrolase [Streptosporangiaceae bacterium]
MDGLTVFYREAGASDAPTLVLLHGFPSASHMFRDLIPLLADRFHLVAPDLPGFGRSEMPARGDFDYTFEHITDVIDRWTEVLGLDRFALYVFDYGADEIQLDLFLDYASNVALYPAFQEYFRTSRPPLLAVWGRNDPFFLPAGAEAFRRHIPDTDVRFVDTGHFALETHVEEIAAAIDEFLTR